MSKFFYQLSKRSGLLLVAFSASFALSSCEGDEGAIGPQGEKGEQGAPGTTGDKGGKGDGGNDGEGGTGAFTKVGFFEGTITGIRSDGTPFKETFKYEYVANLAQTMENDVFGTKRYSQSNFESPSVSLDAQVLNKGTEKETLRPYQFEFSFSKEIGDKMFKVNAYLYYSYYSNNIEISNYVHNMTTGVISYDFTYTGTGANDNSTGKALTITGKFNSGKNVYTEIVNRKGN